MRTARPTHPRSCPQSSPRHRPLSCSLLPARALLLALALPPASGQAQSLGEAVAGGRPGAVFNLRYEDVDQQGGRPDAAALTLRSALSYDSGAFKGFSALVEVENVASLFGQDDYSVPQTGLNPGRYAVIADPETTELNQAYLQFRGAGLTARLGRQQLVHDAQRFLGPVGWRQDWQSFDAVSLDYQAGEALRLSYAWLDKRERVFAEAQDIDANDHMLRAALDTPLGSLVGYGYLLDADGPLRNGQDSWGLRLSGRRSAAGLDWSYLLEAARQDAEAGPASFSADYLLLEAGAGRGGITARLGWEVLGSDGGAYGFATPLATLHAFNGWADMFPNTPAQGLRDAYLNLSGALWGGSWTAVYHDYRADEGGAGVDDLGTEINLQYTRAFASHYTLGLKYADYREGDLAALGDTRKYWLWLQARF